MDLLALALRAASLCAPPQAAPTVHWDSAPCFLEASTRGFVLTVLGPVRRPVPLKATGNCTVPFPIATSPGSMTRRAVPGGLGEAHI